MAFEAVRRSIVSAQLLTRFAAEHGMTPEDCLRGTGLTQPALADPLTEITVQQELQLLRNLVARIGDRPALGLEAGRRYHLSTYGALGFALMSCTDMRALTSVAERYLDLSYALVRFQFEHRAQELVIRLDDSRVPEDLRRFAVERDFAAWGVATREVLPDGLPVLGVEFRFPEPAYAEAFREFCGCTPRFSAPENLIRIDAAILDRPLPQGNPATATLLLEQCRRLLAKRQLHVGIAGQVRNQLLQASTGLPSLELVAAQLQLSPRQLRRRLREEGTHFRALVDEVQALLAQELLAIEGMKLEEVAQRLGYSEAASFIHAFKRWTGVPPGRFRGQRARRR